MGFRTKTATSPAPDSATQRGHRSPSWISWALLRFSGVLLLLTLVAVSVPSLDAASSKLRRYPYLTDVVGSYATINWATDNSSKVGTVTWGKADSEACTAHTASATYTS